MWCDSSAGAFRVKASPPSKVMAHYRSRTPHQQLHVGGHVGPYLPKRGQKATAPESVASSPKPWFSSRAVPVLGVPRVASPLSPDASPIGCSPPCTAPEVCEWVRVMRRTGSLLYEEYCYWLLAGSPLADASEHPQPQCAWRGDTGRLTRTGLLGSSFCGPPVAEKT